MSYLTLIPLQASRPHSISTHRMIPVHDRPPRPPDTVREALMEIHQRGRDSGRSRQEEGGQAGRGRRDIGPRGDPAPRDPRLGYGCPRRRRRR